MFSFSAILFFCAILRVENYPNKGYNCPEFDRNWCTESPSYENQDMFQCNFDYNCGYGYKCCNHCRYGYKVCSDTGLKKHTSNNYDYLKDKYCPVPKSYVTPSKYDFKYYCSCDGVCPFGSKCCRSSLYTHKVCVTPIDKDGNEIIPPPTTLRFFRTSLTKESSSLVDEYTKENMLYNTKRPIQISSSGDGFYDDDDEGDDDDYGSGSGNDEAIIKTKPSLPIQTTGSKHATEKNSQLFGITESRIHTTQKPIKFSSSGDEFSDDDNSDDNDSESGSGDVVKIVIQTTPSSPLHTTTANFQLFGTSINQENTLHKTVSPIEYSSSGDGFSDDDGTDDEFAESGSGNSADDIIQTKPFPPIHISSQYTTQSSSPRFSTTITKEIGLYKPLRTTGFTNSGDGFSDDDDSTKDEFPESGSGNSDVDIIQTKPFPPIHISSKYTTESSSPRFSTTITKEIGLHKTLRPVGVSSRNRFSDDDGSGSDNDNNEYGSGDKAIIQATPSPVFRTTLLEFSGSGNDEPFKDSEDGSSSGDYMIFVEQQVSSPPSASSEVGLAIIKSSPFSEETTPSDFVFYDENNYKLTETDLEQGYNDLDDDVLFY